MLLREDFLADTKSPTREMAFPEDTTEAWNYGSHLVTMGRARRVTGNLGTGAREPLDEPAPQLEGSQGYCSRRS